MPATPGTPRERICGSVPWRLPEERRAPWSRRRRGIANDEGQHTPIGRQHRAARLANVGNALLSRDARVLLCRRSRRGGEERNGAAGEAPESPLHDDRDDGCSVASARSAGLSGNAVAGSVCVTARPPVRAAPMARRHERFRERSDFSAVKPRVHRTRELT